MGLDTQERWANEVGVGEGAGTEVAGLWRRAGVKKGAGLRGWARPDLVYITLAQLLHFL